MSETAKPELGMIVWTDLTVDNAEEVRGFYEQVVGWQSTDVSMGDYNDFSMCLPTSQKAVAGVCHARGTNSGMPAQWLVYVTVEDVRQSVARCVELGGRVVVEPKSLSGSDLYCVIEDPAGAVVALYEPA